MALLEMAAENDEELMMMKFLDEMTLTEETIKGIPCLGMVDRSGFPVVLVSAEKNIGLWKPHAGDHEHHRSRRDRYARSQRTPMATGSR